MSPHQALVFGDLNHDFDSSLRVLFRVHDNPILISFFERTEFALRAQIGSLSPSKRAGFPKFTTLSELHARVRVADVVHPALHKALILVMQFGLFIRYVLRSRPIIVSECLIPGLNLGCSQTIH